MSSTEQELREAFAYAVDVQGLDITDVDVAFLCFASGHHSRNAEVSGLKATCDQLSEALKSAVDAMPRWISRVDYTLEFPHYLKLCDPITDEGRHQWFCVVDRRKLPALPAPITEDKGE